MSLRARNRINAMRAAQAAAFDLFEAYCFEEVTVEEVAEAADLSPSTLYRHFGTKEQLVLWDELDGAIEGALREHLGRCEPLQALRRALVESCLDLNAGQLKHMRRRAKLIDGSSALISAMVFSLEEARREIQAVLVRVYRKPKDPAKLEMVARIAIAALVAGFENWQASKKSLTDCIDGAFDAAQRALS